MDDNSLGDKSERQVVFRELVDLPSTTYGTFGLYRYPAKFIPHVISYILKNYANPGMKVFDPFAGYGTVGVVSRIYGNDYELWDLNPILKTLHSIAILEPKDVEIDRILKDMISCQDKFIPNWSNFDYWFPREFIPLLAKVWGYYHLMDDEYIKLLFTIPLLKISRYYSYDDMARMKLSKSPKSIQRVNEILATDWKSKFFEMIHSETERVLRGLKEYQTLSPKNSRAKICSGIDTLTKELDEPKDILITSPPYLQSQEYIRQAKIDLFWLGYSERKIKELGKLEIPYRNVRKCPVQSETYSNVREGIEEDHIRQVYDRYFWGVIGTLNRLQRDVNRYLFLFVGRSSMRGRPVPIDRILVEHFSEMGWHHDETLVDTIAARRMFSYRINPATGMKDKRTATEHLVILSKF